MTPKDAGELLIAAQRQDYSDGVAGILTAMDPAVAVPILVSMASMAADALVAAGAVLGAMGKDEDHLAQAAGLLAAMPLRDAAALLYSAQRQGYDIKDILDAMRNEAATRDAATKILEIYPQLKR
jgi:hypothetical protein